MGFMGGRVAALRAADDKATGDGRARRRTLPRTLDRGQRVRVRAVAALLRGFREPPAARVLEHAKRHAIQHRLRRLEVSSGCGCREVLRDAGTRTGGRAAAICGARAGITRADRGRNGPIERVETLTGMGGFLGANLRARPTGLEGLGVPDRRDGFGSESGYSNAQGSNVASMDWSGAPPTC